jgi:hypothetical protein
VATSDVAGLVRQHALDLSGCVGRDDQAGMNMDVLTIRHKRVERRVVDHVEADVFRIESRDIEDRISPLAQRFFNFGIPDQALGRGRDSHGQRGCCHCDISQESTGHAGPVSVFRHSAESTGLSQQMRGASYRITELSGFS